MKIIQGSTQLIKFAESLIAIHESRDIPKDGYKGDYMYQLAKDIGDYAPVNYTVTQWAVWGSTRMIAQQKQDLKIFGVEFDTWFSEQSLHDSKGEKLVKALCKAGILWLEGKQGPVCSLCCYPLTPYEPCRFCNFQVPIKYTSFDGMITYVPQDILKNHKDPGEGYFPKPEEDLQLKRYSEEADVSR